MQVLRRVAVCALTYMRPEGLRRLLTGLAELDVPPGTELRVVIVDNDPAGSAQDIVSSATAGFPHALEYVHQPARGISQARNVAIAAARTWNADAIAFVDDDEWPDRSWLVEFMSTLDTTGADIVTGPVLPVFDHEPPKWVIEGGFFDRRRHEHEERIRYATTSTVIIRASILADRPEPFDAAFGLSGGEDTHLFAELREAGFVSVWCDRGLVYEAIPESRVNLKWILRREYRRGQTLSLSLRVRSRDSRKYLRRAANGIWQITRGLVATLVGVVRGRAGWANGLKQVVFGAGMLTGLVGRRYQEYSTVHGR